MRTIKPKENDKEYILRVTALISSYYVLSGKNNCKVVNSKAMPWRKIAILGRQSLYKFAESIVNSFDFYFDHCFGFYSNINSNFYHDSERQFELFADLDDIEPTEAGSVKKTKVSGAWSKVGDKMTFLFDYGDGWRFLVELLEITEADKTKDYPAVSEKFRQAPVQYPPIE